MRAPFVGGDDLAVDDNVMAELGRRRDDGSVRCGPVVASAEGFGGMAALAGIAKFTYQIYSPDTKYFGKLSFLGGFLGAGGGLTQGDILSDFISLDAVRPFSALELHGAGGYMTFGSVAFGLGIRYAWISARQKGGRDYLFEDTFVPSIPAGIGIGAGYMRGTWLLGDVYNEGGPPLSTSASADSGFQAASAEYLNG